MATTFQQLQETASYIQQQYGSTPLVGIVLGSGLGNFVQEINLNEFANGTYIMRVITDGAVYTQRIVKQE